MSLEKLNQKLKGGPGSGHHGHAGRPGKRGGSDGAPSGVGGLASMNSARSKLYNNSKTELSNLERNGLTTSMGEHLTGALDNVKTVELYGSFVSDKSKPNDIDALVHVGGRLNATQDLWNTTQVFGQNNDILAKIPSKSHIIFVDDSKGSWVNNLRNETKRKYSANTVQLPLSELL